MKSIAFVAWTTIKYVLVYVAVNLTLLNLQPIEQINADPTLRAIERLAFAITAGTLTYRLLHK